MLKISMIDANDFIENVTLDGVSYKLHFAWNDRSGGWTFDLRTSDNSDIVRGVAIVPNFPLLNTYKRHDVPDGEFMAVITDETVQAIGRRDFISGQASFVYIPRGEMDAIMEAAV